MLGPLIEQFARIFLRARRGLDPPRIGLSRREWLLGAEALTPLVIEPLVEEIAERCRERMSASQTPCGIDPMALAIACAEPGGSPIASTTFGVFRPVEFYTAGGVAERLTTYMRGLPLPERHEREGSIRFAADLVSGGDVAKEAVFTDEQR